MAAVDQVKVGPVTEPGRSAFSWVVAVATLALVLWLLYERRDDLSAVQEISPWHVVGLLLLQSFYLVLQSGRYQEVLNKCGDRPIGFFQWLRLFIVGRFLNLFAPQAGNVYRGVELKRGLGLTFTRYLAALVSVAWIATMLNFAVAAVIVLLFQPELEIAGVSAALLLILALSATAALPLLAAYGLAIVEPRLRWVRWARGRTEELLRVTTGNFRDRKYAFRVVGWSLAILFQAVLIYSVCFSAVGAGMGLPQVIAFYVILQLTSLVSVTPGNIGVQELAFGFVGAGIGAGAVEGVLVSALLRVTGLFATVALALAMGGRKVLRLIRRGAA